VGCVDSVGRADVGGGTMGAAAVGEAAVGEAGVRGAAVIGEDGWITMVTGSCLIVRSMGACAVKPEYCLTITPE